MQIVDAQIHTWGRGLPSNLSHRQVTAFTPEEAIVLMDEARVNGAVIHPQAGTQTQPIWLQGGPRLSRPLRHHGLAAARPVRLPRADRPMARSTGHAGFALHLPARSQPPMAGRRHNRLALGCSGKGRHSGRRAGNGLAGRPRPDRRTPSGLRLTIDHLGGRGGLTTLKDAAAMIHIPRLLALAKHPNIAVKATGAPGYSSRAYPFPAMHTYLRQIYDAFGPHRMFWGTDITKMPCSWRQCVTMFTEQLPWLSESNKALIMGDALCAWWGWNRPT